MLGEVPILSNALDAALSSDGFRVRHLVPGKHTRVVATHRYEVDFSSTKSLQELHAMLTADGSNSKIRVGGLISLLGLSSNAGGRDALASQSQELPLWMFQTVKEFADDFQESAESGGGLVVNFTSMGGDYAIHEPARASATQAALVGLLKTVAREMPRLSVKNVDVDATGAPEMLFPRILEEISDFGSDVEVGIHAGRRIATDLVAAPLSTDRLGKIDLDSESVVLVTGGARGVTALVAQDLARETGSRFVLVGRTPLPDVELAELRRLTDAAALRKHFISAARASNERVTPAQIERSVQAVLRDREIRSHIAIIGEHAAEIAYQAVDVRDDRAFAALIEGIYERWGRIDAVIHGAGLIEDKLIRDKTPESFARVFGTKVGSAETLVRCLRTDTLKYLVFFASVSGRFGNAGQADYSAANEYLSKLACKLNAEWPARTLAVSWGPWDAGMVSDELRRLYIAHGIHPMPPKAAVRALLDELRLREGPPEIVLGCNVRRIAELGKEKRTA